MALNHAHAYPYCKVPYHHTQLKSKTLISTSRPLTKIKASSLCCCTSCDTAVGLAQARFFTARSGFQIGFGFRIQTAGQIGIRNGVRLSFKYGEAGRSRCLVSFRSDEDDEDSFYMKKAVALARKAVGFTSPNPMVGCVIVKDGEIVGEGFHPKAGQPHAEVFALRSAGEAAEGATAYVTLEPCNHYGRTPPCTEALIKAKVKKVVIGMVDPNPIVASRGVERLRHEGIEVVVGVEEDLCNKLLEAYTHKMLLGKPFVTLRYSVSINGVHLNQLGEAVREPGGYYSQLLQEYDAIVLYSALLFKEHELPASQEAKANQPLYVIVANNPNYPLSVPSLPSKGTDLRAVVFANNELAVQPETAQRGIETVLMDPISLDEILDYCTKQGLCSVLLDTRGEFDGLEEILKEGLHKELVQKVVVEVLPFWANSTVEIPSQLIRVGERLQLKGLLTKIAGKSVLIEGYL